jgi:hypothetical protein
VAEELVDGHVLPEAAPLAALTQFLPPPRLDAERSECCQHALRLPTGHEHVDVDVLR